MNEAWNFEKCVSVLTGEIELLKKIFAAQEKVRLAVMSREWADFDEKTAEVNRLGEEFSILEEERVRLFSALGCDEAEKKPIYAQLSGLPMEESRELARLYREIKMETLRIRSMSETMMAYLNEAKTLASAYLEAVCPARGGKLYGRKGRKISQDLRSIVINNRF